MALDLVSYLAAGGETPRLWINFNDYTKKLLLGKDENPWTNPAAYMSFYRQAHGLVKAQVEAYAPRELLAEVITALANNYSSSAPLVMVMPSPRALLVKAHQAANGETAEPDEMSVDTAAMYVADFLRYFSETELSGVLLVEDPELMPASGAELAWYQPVYNVAKHYRWSVGSYLPTADADFDVPADLAFTIAPSASPLGAKSKGVEVTDLLWGDQAGEPLPSVQGFYYLTIPSDAKPELVLDTLSSLKG